MLQDYCMKQQQILFLVYCGYLSHSGVVSVCSHEVQEILFTLNLDLAEFCSDKQRDKIEFRANYSKLWLKGVQLYWTEESSFQQNIFILKKKKKKGGMLPLKKAKVQGVHSKP